jgi:hypothetical protein
MSLELEVPSNLFIEVSFPENQQQQSEFTSEGEKTLNSAVFETKVNFLINQKAFGSPLKQSHFFVHSLSFWCRSTQL